jgi:hypothetical protein
MITAIIITIIIIAILIYINKKNENEKFSGALTQLYAKGPQDIYLTTDIEKYVPELWHRYPNYMWSNGNYYPLFWNMPTRYGYYSPYYIPELYDLYYSRYPYIRYY